MEQLESILMKCVEETISEKIDVLIEKAENDFHKKLVDRKDEYIAEVMRGVRMVHEYNPEMMCVDYRILFVNKCQVNGSEKPNNCKDEARIITDGTYLYAYDKMLGEWRPIQDISGHKQTERSSE